MAAVLQPGIRVPILAGGPAAEVAAAWLNKLGMNITPVASEVRRASAIKLCRSIMIKGIEALILDCASASRHWGVEREVYGSLGQTFPSIAWSDLADAMAERVATHGIRRAGRCAKPPRCWPRSAASPSSPERWPMRTSAAHVLSTKETARKGRET